MSPCFARQVLWLGVSFERVASVADGWMGAGTWGWCSVQHNIRQHKKHEDVSRNQHSGTSDAVAISHPQERSVETVEEVGWVQEAGTGTQCCGAILASVHELSGQISSGSLVGLTHSDQAQNHRAQGEFLTRWWSGRRWRWRWRASCTGMLREGRGSCWTRMERRTSKAAEGIL